MSGSLARCSALLAVSWMNEPGERAQHPPVIGGREHRRAHIGRHRKLIEPLRTLGEVGEAVDHLAGRAHPARHILVECHEILIDLVGKPHQGGLHHALAEVADLQRQIGRRELEVDALLRVDGERGLAFGHVLDGGHGAGAHREGRRPADRDRLAGVVAVHLLVEFVLVGAVNEIRHDEVVLEDHQRLVGDDVRVERAVAHALWILLGGLRTLSTRPSAASAGVISVSPGDWSVRVALHARAAMTT